MSETLRLARELIARSSVTPDDAGCQEIIADRLRDLGFEVESMQIGDVTNLWARRGSDTPLLCLAGHTDVVPVGHEEEWTHPPFEPTEDGGWLYGRGSADMKSALAAMLVACEEFLQARPDHPGSLAFLITSDEEGIAVDGTRAVIECLEDRGESIDLCLIGEPSCNEILGDTVRVGRRGSLSAELTVLGKQGHVAYADLARNPLHDLAPALAELSRTRWDEGNDAFPPTGFQATNIQAGTGAMNVIPGSCQVRFNLRYSTEQTMAGLQEKVESVLDRHGLDYRIQWRDVGRPFLTAPGVLTEAIRRAVVEELGVEPEMSTGGGTSDGRFISPHGAQVIEFGLLNATIHQVDERTPVADLDRLKIVYRRALELILDE
ncbi:MAG: succinyl-diaminopimelate desuccinylase [Chromatiales bacterium]|nr:succinyl-diaminopimelate desuccinylase [Chromatiales bacterium]